MDQGDIARIGVETMKNGYLSQYFDGVAVKSLSAVEADILRSHQHEFNGVGGLRDILGEPEGKVHFTARFVYMTDQDNEAVVEDGLLTWYDARQKAREERHVMRKEYRLYFSDNQALQLASEGDSLIVARQSGGLLLAIVAEKDTTIERQLLWLFGFSGDIHPGFSIRSELETEQDRIGYAARIILEQIGIVDEEDAPDYLEQMLTQFHGSFPKTNEFSEFARNTLKDIDSRDCPDTAFVAWMEREEILYRTLEKHIIGDSLKSLIDDGDSNTPEPEPFIKLVQSTLQRRKSRAGSAMENHLEQIFSDHKILYTRQGVTENRLRPDFIFPGITYYHEPMFPSMNLTMLASKSTCKDRWRQILNEAAKISVKHLITLEPGISEHQTDEMKSENVQLVLPLSLYNTFTDSQRNWFMSVSEFIDLVKTRQLHTNTAN